MGNPKRGPIPQGFEINEDHPQFVTALARGMSILRCFERGEHYLGNQEIARRTGLPKPTVSRLTFTLASLGYLSYSPSLEKYALGINVLSLGHAFMKGSDIVNVARPLMQELADYAQAAVMLGASDGTHNVLLDISQGDPTFHLKLEAGSRVPHGTTALGRAYLAALPLPGFQNYLDSLRSECAPGVWQKLKTGILRAREDYEQYGFCFSLGDWKPELFAVGVPIISADRERIYALNCSGRVALVTRERLLHDLGPRLVAMRNKIYDLLGGRF